jgi:hypothetical protein
MFLIAYYNHHYHNLFALHFAQLRTNVVGDFSGPHQSPEGDEARTPCVSALLQVPGIQDVVFDRRAGTFTCYVYAITPVAAASVLSMVQDTIDTTVAFPLTGTAVNPDLVGISLATTITLVAGSTQVDKDTAAGQAAAAAQDYLNNLRVGDPLIITSVSLDSQKPYTYYGVREIPSIRSVTCNYLCFHRGFRRARGHRCV